LRRFDVAGARGHAARRHRPDAAPWHEHAAVGAGFEHAVVPLDGRLRVGPEVVEPGSLALVPPGAPELPLEADRDGARLLLLGGEPLGEPIQMWWNFVARDGAEIEAARRHWRDGTDRFGDVPSPLARVDAPRPPWMPLRD
jgi:redox-sensitive bicupin YhaK (pirin superfamily)